MLFCVSCQNCVNREAANSLDRDWALNFLANWTARSLSPQFPPLFFSRLVYRIATTVVTPHSIARARAQRLL